MKEQFQIHELLEVKHEQRKGQAFIDKAFLYGMYNQSSVYKPFCTETGLRHYSQKTNAKLTEPLEQSLD